MLVGFQGEIPVDAGSKGEGFYTEDCKTFEADASTSISAIILHCHSPKQKLWNPAGVATYYLDGCKKSVSTRFVLKS